MSLGYLKITCDSCHVLIADRRVSQEEAKIYFSKRHDGRLDYCKVCA